MEMAIFQSPHFIYKLSQALSRAALQGHSQIFWMLWVWRVSAEDGGVKRTSRNRWLKALMWVETADVHF